MTDWQRGIFRVDLDRCCIKVYIRFGAVQEKPHDAVHTPEFEPDPWVYWPTMSGTIRPGFLCVRFEGEMARWHFPDPPVPLRPR